MRYKASESELENMQNMSASERIFYFVQRSCEAEEVWGLSSSSGWVMTENEDISYLPVWPYREMSVLCIGGEWGELEPDAVSLEHFLYNILPMMVKEGIGAEVMPAVGSEGERLSALELKEYLESVVDAGDYYMEG